RCAERAAARATIDGPDAALADLTRLPDVEEARERVEAHALADHRDETRVDRALAGVRLARWLALPARAVSSSDLGAQVARHRDTDAWVDRAVADAWSGVGDEGLSQGLRAVLGAARLRRDAHDSAFGLAVATHERAGGGVPEGFVNVEDLLAGTVLPLAKEQPVLLVLADGMSFAAATEVVDDVVRRYESWLECLPAGRRRRTAALAALPSLTNVSRASLLSGELTVGDQTPERVGFEKLAKAHGVSGRLFHKLSLDTSEGGFALAHDIAGAVDDVAGTRLVACVLNTIDDALERSDPGGTEWTADTVKHLRPLLDRARRAGRVVVLTSDHGHVVERREGRMIPVKGASSNRSRPHAEGPPPGEGEVRVTGRRVLLHNADAVLVAEERLRYGPLKAGYHGGAAPAEVVVPVHVLTPGAPPEGWALAPPQSPDWWRTPVGAAGPRPAPEAGPSAPTLFDGVPVISDIAVAVVASPTYRDQRSRSARVTIQDGRITELLRALLAAPANRLDPESAAAALGIAAVQLPGALSMVQRLLNVEQYPVLSRDPDGATVVLDSALLREQFEVEA
ncbi:MAG: BREX-2 system phosphatase PglZ, partial [Streptomycetales bacterium]